MERLGSTQFDQSSFQFGEVSFSYLVLIGSIEVPHELTKVPINSGQVSLDNRDYFAHDLINFGQVSSEYLVDRASRFHTI